MFMCSPSLGGKRTIQRDVCTQHSLGAPGVGVKLLCVSQCQWGQKLETRHNAARGVLGALYSDKPGLLAALEKEIPG